MKHLTAILATTLLAVIGAEAKPLKVFILAVQTAAFWSDELGGIDAKCAQISQMSYFLDSKHKDHANAAGKMPPEQKKEYLKTYETDLITPAELALWKRSASNADYHDLGCAKTFALMGKNFAEANLKMMKRL